MKNKVVVLVLIIIILFTGYVFYKNTNHVQYKEVNINDQYSIKTPSDFSMTQVPYTITNVPNYGFTGPNHQNSFSVMVSPYLSSNSPIDGQCAISTDSTKVYCEGVTLTKSFLISGFISGNQKVFYGTKYGDLTQDCTAISGCQHPPADQRYSVTYIFIIPRQTDNTLVEFWAADAVRKSSPQVNSFEGVGALLHDTVIPSLRLIGEN
jgi:hypothetical protein